MNLGSCEQEAEEHLRGRQERDASGFPSGAPERSDTEEEAKPQSREEARDSVRKEGSGFRVQGSGFRVEGGGWKVEGWACHVPA